ncbi:MAG: hypothetical protein M1368_11810, partial [Thaumarchaeota archaeon]|nr:hypothetical protein [Nitrososphaerota archaeon]
MKMRKLHFALIAIAVIVVATILVISTSYTTHRIDEIPACFTHAMLLRYGSVVAKGKILNTLTAKNMSRC